jgi:hypothetical protein
MVMMAKSSVRIGERTYSGGGTLNCPPILSILVDGGQLRFRTV